MKTDSPDNMTDKMIALQELLKIIDRYFDCTLSDTEEKKLIQYLAVTRYSHPAIEEAKAVIGIRLNSSRRYEITGSKEVNSYLSHSNLRDYIYPSFGVAAALALIISLATFFFTSSNSSTFIAYSGGVRLTDEDEVMKMLQSQMIEFDTQQKNQLLIVSEELSEIEPVSEEINDISVLFQ